eukprot:1183484-Prorocentrum_minimum.AAC.4
MFVEAPTAGPNWSRPLWAARLWCVLLYQVLNKAHIVKKQLTEHVFRERDIGLSIRSSFVTRIHHTAQDEKNIYLFMDPVLGSEVSCVMYAVMCAVTYAVMASEATYACLEACKAS